MMSRSSAPAIAADVAFGVVRHGPGAAPLGLLLGWPRCVNGTTPDSRFSGGCSGVTPPALTFQAHSAPLGATFYTDAAFPSDFQGDLFVACHGSWNRTQRTGYKVVRVAFSGSQPTG